MHVLVFKQYKMQNNVLINSTTTQERANSLFGSLIDHEQHTWIWHIASYATNEVSPCFFIGKKVCLAVQEVLTFSEYMEGELMGLMTTMLGPEWVWMRLPP